MLMLSMALVVYITFLTACNESLSILENTVHLGLPVPEKLKDVLAQLHHRDDKENQ